MRRWLCMIPLGLAAELGCSPAAREEVKRFFFEVPEASPGHAAASAPVEPEIQATATQPNLDVGKSVFASVHPPVTKHECENCHDPDQHMRVEPGAFKTACKQCHPRFFADHVSHSPVADGQCLSCHDPHRSPYAHLLTQAMPGVCIGCHSLGDLGKPTHDLETVGQCASCHDPHFGNSPYLRTQVKADAAQDS